MTGNESSVTAVSFSPDGKRIASSGDDRTVRLWDSATSLPIGDPFNGHLESVTSVAFNPNNGLLVTSSKDGALRLWPAPAAWPQALCTMLTTNMSQKDWTQWVSPDIRYVTTCPTLEPSP